MNLKVNPEQVLTRSEMVRFREATETVGRSFKLTAKEDAEMRRFFVQRIIDARPVLKPKRKRGRKPKAKPEPKRNAIAVGQ